MAPTTKSRRQSGFTLLELLVSMVIVLVVTGGALTAFSEALKANDTINQKLQMNDQMRIALDLLVRDLIQTGQGLPTTKVISAPSGGGATAVRRPSPPNKSYLFPQGTTEFPAVVSGDEDGPTVNSHLTDTITVFYA
ncbi:MAG: PilW family protein, partial [Vicinamibacterales bacterium]